MPNHSPNHSCAFLFYVKHTKISAYWTYILFSISFRKFYLALSPHILFKSNTIQLQNIAGIQYTIECYIFFSSLLRLRRGSHWLLYFLNSTFNCIPCFPHYFQRSIYWGFWGISILLNGKGLIKSVV